jgi:hypothetical protein
MVFWTRPRWFPLYYKTWSKSEATRYGLRCGAVTERCRNKILYTNDYVTMR